MSFALPPAKRNVHGTVAGSDKQRELDCVFHAELYVDPHSASMVPTRTVEAKKDRAVGMPKVTQATVFEVVTDGKLYRVKGEALQRWIMERRQKWSGQGTCSPSGQG